MWSVRHGVAGVGALAAATSLHRTAGVAGCWWRRRQRRGLACGGGEGGPIPLKPLYSRPLHCSAACCDRPCRHKKLVKMYLHKKMSKFWYDNPTLDFQMVTKSSSLENRPKGIPPKFTKEHNIRKRTLDVLLLRALTDVLSSYELGQEVYDLQVELSQVSVSSDFSSCNVYWRSTGYAEKDEHVARVLKKNAGEIRCFLITNQVLRCVPFLVFIQDKEDAIIREVERLLAIADFGPEEENDQVQNNISEQSSATTATCLDSSHSPTLSNLFGVDHDALNKKITEFKKREDKKIEWVGLSEQQQKQLAEIRKQKKLKRKKVRNIPDDDLTPQKYLMEKYAEDNWDSEMEESEEEEQLLDEEGELEAEDRTTHTE